MIDLLKIEEDDKKINCKGLVWRGYVSTYRNKLTNNITSKSELRFLKSKSCKGCYKCDWQHDILFDLLYDSKNEFLLDDIEHGKLYTIHFNFSKDWESGYEEIEDFVFIEYNEEENEI